MVLSSLSSRIDQLWKLGNILGNMVLSAWMGRANQYHEVIETMSGRFLGSSLGSWRRWVRGAWGVRVASASGAARASLRVPLLCWWGRGLVLGSTPDSNSSCHLEAFSCAGWRCEIVSRSSSAQCSLALEGSLFLVVVLRLTDHLLCMYVYLYHRS